MRPRASQCQADQGAKQGGRGLVVALAKRGDAPAPEGHVHEGVEGQKVGAHREKGLRGRNADTRLGRPTQRGRQGEHWRGRGGLSAAGRASGNRTGFEGRWRGRPTTWALRPAELACPFQPRGPRAHGCPESERNPEVPENTAGHPTSRQGSLRPYNAAAPSGFTRQARSLEPTALSGNGFLL